MMTKTKKSSIPGQEKNPGPIAQGKLIFKHFALGQVKMEA